MDLNPEQYPCNPGNPWNPWLILQLRVGQQGATRRTLFGCITRLSPGRMTSAGAVIAGSSAETSVAARTVKSSQLLVITAPS